MPLLWPPESTTRRQENLRAELDKESGQIRAYAVRTIVEDADQIEDPTRRSRWMRPSGLIRRPKSAANCAPTSLRMCWGGLRRSSPSRSSFRRCARRNGTRFTTSTLAASEKSSTPRSSARKARMSLSTWARPKRDAAQGAVAAGIVRSRRARAGGDRARREGFQGPAGCGLARRAGVGVALVPDGSARDLRQHRVIRAIAREAGERTKIAVMSKDKDVDPVGACVGMKGMRVQSIIRELRGEKIDIIEYHEDPVIFAEKALTARESQPRNRFGRRGKASGGDRGR